MSEPQRRNETTRRDDASHPGPAAQIERLLLAGLDLYFTGHYQEAINIWTRVVFLERGHGRAKAYIERARSAIAEQQREADELFHRGRAACDRGDLDEARRHLALAVDRGGSSDDALQLLQQLNRFSGPQAAGEPVAQPVDGVVGPGRADDGGWLRVLAAIAAMSALALGAAPLVSWFAVAPAVDVAEVGIAPSVDPLPVVRGGAEAIVRARALYAGGHLSDALRALERIDVGDPARQDAERLRGEIQRDLLALVRQAPASAAAPQGMQR